MRNLTIRTTEPMGLPPDCLLCGADMDRTERAAVIIEDADERGYYGKAMGFVCRSCLGSEATYPDHFRASLRRGAKRLRSQAKRLEDMARRPDPPRKSEDEGPALTAAP